jgi:cellobiose phosphorylase
MSQPPEKNKQKALFQLLPQAIIKLKRNIIDPFFAGNNNADDERLPFRSEIFTEEQLEQHAKFLSQKHPVVAKYPSEQLLKRLAENESILLEVHSILTENVKQSNRIAPAAEWLLDNFYLIEEQIYTAKKHLPKGYSKGLPRLIKGAASGMPRVYDIAVEIISHTDGHVNLTSLTGFVRSYQLKRPLELGELWAIPIMLRLALLENLRRLSIQMSIDLSNKSLAESWADQFITTTENDPKNLVLIIADMARSKPAMSGSFVAELTRRLQEKGNALALAMNWLEQTLSENGQTSVELIQQENRKQAADQVSISNSISSLRFLSTTDWGEFVEVTSIVEQTLKLDPAGIYGKMDFSTRDNYRHVVESISKNADLSEEAVAALAVESAKQNFENEKDPITGHVGYFLVGRGLKQLEKRSRLKVDTIERCKRIVGNTPFLMYAGGIFLLTGLITLGLAAKAITENLSTWKQVTVIVLSFMAAGQLAFSLVNWLITVFSKPCLLPRMNFSKGIPEEHRTMVVVPTIIDSISGIARLIENLEVRFLANRDANLSFGLLTDFKDARTAELPDDRLLLDFVSNEVTALNRKYDRVSDDTFFLFHRPRTYNARDKTWMGYERKRGKIGEFNALILGRGKAFFSRIIGEEKIYSAVKYVITLDTDTQLPRDAAWKMVATMAHPLNQPVYNEKKGLVTDGYTILQPRVSNSLATGNSSVYARIHGNEPGTDPYTRAISDIYQDLFKEGSYIGKGIYDVEAFEKVLHNKFRPNRILSHDLLEGAYTRSGLISDVQLYEQYPSGYITDMQRRHRWVRGDWQIAGWILPFVRSHDIKLRKNPLTLLSKWKIADNLRRSLVPVSLLLLLLFAWIISMDTLFWTGAVVAVLFLPALVNVAWQLFKRPADVIFIQHFIYISRSFKDSITQLLIDFICLPYVVYINADAVLRTGWRMLISRKNLLQWNPYSAGTNEKSSVTTAFSKMWFGPFFTVVVGIYLGIYFPVTLIKVVPLLIAWFFSPVLVWYISRPLAKKVVELFGGQRIFLRKLARKTWAFFETYVTKEENWLPPDNYQEQPVERIAHRTSPTNIGLSLLCNLTACDFGYCTIKEFIEMTANTITTVEGMEKYRGHLYNWYDTQSLVPLKPKYISTVDSGNFTGHIITLQQGLLALPDKKIITAATFEGLLDELRILLDKAAIPGLQEFTDELAATYHQHLDNLPAVKKYTEGLEKRLMSIFLHMESDPANETGWWIQKVFSHLETINNDLSAFVPWYHLPAAPRKFENFIPTLPGIPTVVQFSKIEQSLLKRINALYQPGNTATENDWLNAYRAGITASGRRSREIILMAEQLAAKCIQLANVDYDFLYDRSQHLLTIGYNADEHRKDNGYYDLLASEARLTTFVAIAQGKLPQQSWFALGRQLTNIGADPILLSWSGSMFEYLMPMLVMPTYENTLLDQTAKAVVQKQIDYGRKRNVPWGISESGYNMVDANLNYQYRAFGVPGIGLKRGLGEELVISPYATVMALMVAPREALDNLVELEEKGFGGKYGFYEAIDYTASRLLRKQNYAVVRSFMAHHQGMSLLSLSYLLLDKPLQRRFEADVQVKSALLLLQEKIPQVTNFYSPGVHEADTSITPAVTGYMRILKTADTAIPEVQLLSNGRYHVMITNAGGGYSRWKNLALTRWREDCTCDNWGTFCFIRDLESNLSWSTAFQPTLKKVDNYEAVFSQGRAEFRRRDNGIEMHTEILVSPEDDLELRRIHITNRSRKKRTIEVTSYAEVVLASPVADELHPAFSNLFVQTEINTARNAITCTRRPRSVNEQNPWMFHLMKVHDADIKAVSYETDRELFIGRGNTIHDPAVIHQPEKLSGSCGSVLDPVVSIQYRIVLEPFQSATVDMIFGVAETKEGCNQLIEKYQDRHLINRVLELAFTHSQVILRQINANESDAQLYSRLASSVIYANASLRADSSTIMKNQRGQSGLWSYSISGDLPIILLQIEDSSNIQLVKQLVQAHAYWRLKGLLVDLVIWNEDHGGYRQSLQNEILGFVTPALSNESKDQAGGIFVRSADQLSNEDRVLFQTVAHVVIADKAGTLEEQINGRTRLKTAIPYFTPSKFPSSLLTSVSLPGDLQFFNGFGGFSKDGKEYIIRTAPGQPTPAPWINVLANPHFGSIISESGQSYTWVDNAHECRLTPWNNDPVSDLRGEVFYLRDEESGRFWSPTALPCRSQSPFITRHGFGYSIFEHSEDGIETEMCVYADLAEPVKFIVLKVRNRSGRKRRLSVTGYVEWVLGDLRSKSLMHTITELDTHSGAILARNAYNSVFGNRVAFFDADNSNKFITTDRAEFIGRNGTLQKPDAMNRTKLSGKSGAALDPCAAIQVAFELTEAEEHTAVFRLGAGKNREDALRIIRKSEGSMAAHDALQRVRDYWTKTLGAVQLETPDKAVNIIANGWLNYQTMACRIWARSGFYQSGGAFGFRDQLQDVLSLLHIQPELAKQQILLCASRQFREGDVQHWWHPPGGRGVRTTCSDDYLWLPFVTSRYISTTGDNAILDENIFFLEGRLLNTDEESYYDLPIQSDKMATLYEHCVTAIEHGLRFGANGLPLIGSGDWNDGMDKVGHQGRGESVWLGFFLYDVLKRFTIVATLKKDTAFVNKCHEQAELLEQNINQHAWDGEWYRRGYFDDGSPLGSSINEECKIDSIAQSWSVLSGAGDPFKTKMAMQSADRYLVGKEDHIIRLFTPPFDTSSMNPGYIKGYVPGVRENGGQYTHAAIWLVMAYAAMGDREKTWELLQLINPVNHGNDPASILQYKAEPYVIAADVYAVEGNTGRGGWTWYTGSAGWMYQLIIESFAGLRRNGAQLRFSPCLPAAWDKVKIRYRYIDTLYQVELVQTSDAGDEEILLDGSKQDSDGITLINDGQLHEVKVMFVNKAAQPGFIAQKETPLS